LLATLPRQARYRNHALETVCDRLGALAGLVLLSPVLVAIALAIVIENGRPVLFRQRRVGRYGEPFELVKFRSMRVGLSGTRITAGQDRRVTRVGSVLRRYKLDELPQLWNVLKGEMSLIGPRPEVPAFVDPRDARWRELLEVRPGIADLASLVYRNEEELLGGAADPERRYRDVIQPAKMALSLHYIRIRSLWQDMRLLAVTLRYSFVPAGFDPRRIKESFLYKDPA
jgi:lipopolysaccharide/colanic/teichoic acid biosynthesis glycosyltransferase